MFKKEEILSKEELKELSEEQVVAILAMTQEKGDGIKSKYEKKATEVEKEAQEKIKDLETKLNSLSKKDDDEEEEEKIPNKLLETINSLEKKLNEIENKNSLKTTKQKLLDQAKENGYDLKKADELFEAFGENLNEDFSVYEKFLTKLDEEDPEGSSLDPDESDPNGSEPELVLTGDKLIDSILKGEE